MQTFNLIATVLAESMLKIMNNILIIYFIFCFIYLIIFILHKKPKSTKSSWISLWCLIKIGFIYAKKIDNHYANLIVKLCKKHLKIKDITTADVLHDLNSSTKFGPVFKYRKLKGLMNSSLLIWIEKKIFTVSGLRIYLHRNPDIKFPLEKYY